MTNKAVGAIGPGTNPNETELKMPSCIQVKTDIDKEELRVFVDDIMQIANRRALKLFEEMMKTHNLTIDAFVSKLGG